VVLRKAGWSSIDLALLTIFKMRPWLAQAFDSIPTLMYPRYTSSCAEAKIQAQSKPWLLADTFLSGLKPKSRFDPSPGACREYRSKFATCRLIRNSPRVQLRPWSVREADLRSLTRRPQNLIEIPDSTLKASSLWKEPSSPWYNCPGWFQKSFSIRSETVESLWIPQSISMAAT